MEPGGGLTYAKAWHESMYGRIESGWKIERDRLHIDVTIPPNTTAEVFIPSASEEITESGQKLADVEYIRKVRTADGFVVVEVGSGSYRFECGAISFYR